MMMTMAILPRLAMREPWKISRKWWWRKLSRSYECSQKTDTHNRYREDSLQESSSILQRFSRKFEVRNIGRTILWRSQETLECLDLSHVTCLTNEDQEKSLITIMIFVFCNWRLLLVVLMMCTRRLLEQCENRNEFLGSFFSPSIFLRRRRHPRHDEEAKEAVRLRILIWQMLHESRGKRVRYTELFLWEKQNMMNTTEHYWL